MPTVVNPYKKKVFTKSKIRTLESDKKTEVNDSETSFLEKS